MTSFCFGFLFSLFFFLYPYPEILLYSRILSLTFSTVPVCFLRWSHPLSWFKILPYVDASPKLLQAWISPELQTHISSLILAISTWIKALPTHLPSAELSSASNLFFLLHTLLCLVASPSAQPTFCSLSRPRALSFTYCSSSSISSPAWALLTGICSALPDPTVLF